MISMLRECIAEGPTVEDAVDAALEELGVQQDSVEYEVIDEPARKIFGLGAGRGAKVRVWLKDDFMQEVETAQEVARDILSDSDLSLSEGTGTALTPERERPAFAVPEDLSEADLDRVADTATEALQSVLSSFGIDAEIEEYEGDEREIILDVVGPDLAILIGRHGRTLDSIQVLVSAITHKRAGFRYPVLIDVEGYRNRRKTKIEEIGLRAAARAARQGSPVRLRPMPALERRIIHMILRDDVLVRTASEGEDPYRSVVIYPNKR